MTMERSIVNGSIIKSFGIICLCLVVGAPLGCVRQPCRLDRSNLPPLLGCQLGMSRDQLEQRFPGLKVKDEPYTELFFSGSKTLPNGRDVSPVDEIGHVTVSTSKFPEFAEIRSLDLRLKDGRVSDIELTYPDTSRWKNEDDFVAFVAQLLKLPDSQSWRSDQQTQYRGGARSVSCNGLTVRAGFHVMVGSGPGGPAPIAFPFVIVDDDNSRRQPGQ